MKKFLVKLSLYLAILSTIVVAVNIDYIYMEKHSDDEIGKFYTVPNNIQICNLGSSHGLYGFNYEDLNGKYTCFNFGLTSQTLSYDYRMLKHYLARLQTDSVVFIPVSYFSFWGKGEIYGDSFQAKNMRYYKILPKDSIKQYDSVADFFATKIPSLVAYEKLFPTILGLREGHENYWRRTADMIDVVQDANAAYKRHIVTKKLDETGGLIYNWEEINAAYEIIELCTAAGIHPILVTTPYLSEYTDTIKRNSPDFYGVFYGIVDEIKRTTGVKYYDYSCDKRFAHDYSLFINGDHLNRSGARKFTNILVHEALGMLGDMID